MVLAEQLLEQQLAGIRRALGDHHEYVYLDGEVAVEQPGMLMLSHLGNGPEKFSDVIQRVCKRRVGKESRLLRWLEG